MAEVDVLIIGGGPAGTAAAIQCRIYGLSCALIERVAFPRECPGETLHPGIEPLLKRLGISDKLLAANFLRHEGVWVEWGSEPRFVPYGQDVEGAWCGFQAWRADFDNLLLEQARLLGATVLQPCKALNVLCDDGRVIGALTSLGERHARFVIDGGGSKHWLASRLHSQIIKYSPSLVARYGYMEGICERRDHAPAIRANGNGWTWTARIRPRLYQWIRLMWSKDSASEDLIPDEFDGLSPRGPTKGANVTWRAVTKPAGLGYFIIGDAAAVLDPLASHGVLKSIMSGMMAAYMIASVLNHKQHERKVAEEYSRWLYNWFSSDVTKLRELYAALSPKPDWV
jgi:flavin-dependent dehydrogenase